MDKYFKARKIAAIICTHIFLLAMAAVSVFPLLWMVSSSLKTQETVFGDMSLVPGAWHFSNYYRAWIDGGFGRYFLNSIFYTSAVVIGIIVIASMAAYAFSRLKFPGKNLIFYMFMAAMMIPIQGSFVPLYVLLNNLHLRDTQAGYILAMINVGLATSIFLMKTFFDKMPKELEDAARIDGCSKIGIWRHVALPLAKPVIAVVVIYNVLNVWNEFMLALLIFDSPQLMPIQVGLIKFQGEFITQYPLLMAGLTTAALPVIILYVFMQKYIVKGVTQGTVVG